MTHYDTLFKQYDIRGIYGTDLNDDDAWKIGRAFGTYIRRKGETQAVVGMDNRLSSPRLKENIVRGLNLAGIDVTDIGTVITPVFYYATFAFNIGAGIMVTASHNPAEYNGFKIQYGGRTLYGPELQAIKEIALTQNFAEGKGSVHMRSPIEDYMGMIAAKIQLGKRRLKVVADAGNGTAGLFVPEVLQRLGCEVIPLYCDSDPKFPHHFPDPTRPENMRDLIEAVKNRHADVGLGFDGDGDRLGVVDNEGNILWGDMIMILFWREILPRHPGADAIVEVKCSERLVQEITKLGGRPQFYKTGHSLIKAKMKELGAVFTGEMSGHMFFADEYYGYDDAVYAAGRLLRILSRTEKSLAQLLSDVPKAFATPEIRIPCAEEKKKYYVEKARAELRRSAPDTIEIDGVRARFADGWGLVRASNTGPELIVRCEGQTEEACRAIKALIARTLSPLQIPST